MNNIENETIRNILKKGAENIKAKFIEDINEEPLEKIEIEAEENTERLKNLGTKEATNVDIISSFTALQLCELVLALKQEGYQIYKKVGAIKHE